jgi:hypothetical protein
LNRRSIVYKWIFPSLLLCLVILTQCNPPDKELNGSDENGEEEGETCLVEGIIKLPQTGQTTIYESGDDGHLQRGMAWPNPRFVDNGDETITDQLTGLMWDKNGNRFEKKSWTEALSDVRTLTLGGYNDWRAPNRNEALSLVNYGVDSNTAWLTSQGFVNVGGFLATSTTYGPDPSWLWGVNVGTLGGLAEQGSSKQHGNLAFLAVRSTQINGVVSLPQTCQTVCYAVGDDGDLMVGVAWPELRFLVCTGIESGCIVDRLTGCMWQRDTSEKVLKWVDAITYTKELSLGGHKDWRLPNIIELETLINAGEHDNDTWLNGQGFVSPPHRRGFWSSTTSAQDTYKAWYIDLKSGYSYYTNKDNYSYVRAVRAGE